MISNQLFASIFKKLKLQNLIMIGFKPYNEIQSFIGITEPNKTANILRHLIDAYRESNDTTACGRDFLRSDATPVEKYRRLLNELVGVGEYFSNVKHNLYLKRIINDLKNRYSRIF
jgi:hypothetical protein